MSVTKSDRVEARVTPAERSRMEHAARLSGTSLSAFMVAAAVERADAVAESEATTAVPPTFFDDLLRSLDEGEAVPALQRAADRARRRGLLDAA